MRARHVPRTQEPWQTPPLALSSNEFRAPPHVRFTTEWPAAVRERDNSVGQVFVDTGEALDDDLNAGVFQHLALNTDLA